MPDIIYYVAASLDGYIATADGGVEWLAPFEQSAEDYGYAEFLASVDALLLGSKTYEQVLGFGPWPYEGKPAWVFTHRDLERANDVTFTSASPTKVAEELDALGHDRVWLVGGAALAAAFRAENLITEYIVSVMPVILGEGIALFGASGGSDSLVLLESAQYESGVVQLRYAAGHR